MQAGSVLLAIGAGLLVYTYVLYPGLLGLWRLRRSRSVVPSDPDVWPTLSISLPAYNEEHQIAETLESLLSLDYPRDRIQILVVSDASADRTDDIVRAYGDRGVELLRLPERRGKGAAEAAAIPHLSGEIVVNTDASIRVVPDALKPLIRQFSDPEVGLASGRDISVAPGVENANQGESKYVGYEMAVRDLETRVGSIVGASGCFYAIRSHLHRIPLPVSLSRDFAAALHCRERGYRAVSVPEAICFVPRAASLSQEYRRKVRTMTRGLQTLLHKRNLINPFRYPLFWINPFLDTPWARVGLLVVGAGVLLGSVGWLASDRRDLPWILELPAFGLIGNVAAMHAMVRVSTPVENVTVMAVENVTLWGEVRGCYLVTKYVDGSFLGRV